MPPGDDEFGRLLPETYKVSSSQSATPRPAAPSLLNPVPAPPPLTVSQVTQRIRTLLETAPLLQEVRVQGEITDYRGPAPSGHHYFSLKDEDSQLTCVLWAGTARGLKTLPSGGAAVVVTGSIAVYPKRGVYQLTVSHLEPAGQGPLWLKFLEMKAQLQEEGLFDPSRKVPLPGFPRVIGVVTSREGAALRDILKILDRRGKHTEVRIAPTLVQGEGAASQILKALQLLDNDPEIDVIILARGGGSLEDLAAFNDEGLIRGLARLETPIIAGVGHETDFTLVDFVADQRAPTPTAAAVMACPDGHEMKRAVQTAVESARGRLQGRIATQQDRLEQLRTRRVLEQPRRDLALRRQEIDETLARIGRGVGRGIEVRRGGVATHTAVLVETHPARLLEKGYAWVTDHQGHVVRSVRGQRPGEPLRVRVADGALQVEIQTVEEEPSNG